MWLLRFFPVIPLLRQTHLFHLFRDRILARSHGEDRHFHQLRQIPAEILRAFYDDISGTSGSKFFIFEFLL